MFFSSESKFRNGRDGVVQRTDLGQRRLPQPSWAHVPAGRMRGEDLSSMFHSGLSSAAREFCQFARFQSQSVFVIVCLRRSARWLVPRASAACPIVYIEVLEATGRACSQRVRFSVRGCSQCVRNTIQQVSS